jgi:AcrR family transcriptional regulator
MAGVTDRKAKRIERIRGEIMDAAIEVISKKGFKGSSTKEIAERADMAEGTLYNYFKNKDDILMSITERYVSYKRNLNVSTDVSSVQEFITNIYTASANFDRSQHLDERRILRALLPEFLTDKVLGKLYFERIVRPFLSTVEEKMAILQENGIVGDYDIRALSRILYSSLIGFAILDINKDPIVSDASDEFRKEAGRAYIEILGKGMAK